MLFEWFASLKSYFFAARRSGPSSVSAEQDVEFNAIVQILLPSYKHPITPHPLQEDIPFIPHVQQEFNWDCGVSCLQMAILWLIQGRVAPDNPSKTYLPSYYGVLRAWIIQTIASESIWTIDLLYALQKFLKRNDDSAIKTTVSKSGDCDELPFCDSCVYFLLTQSINTPKEYANVQYYKLKFQDDRKRVSQRLQQVRTHDRASGMLHDSVRQWAHPLGIQQIVYCIQNKNCIAIALIDHAAFTSYGRSDDKSKSRQYVGHYILLAGISSDPVHIQEALSIWHAKTMNVGVDPKLELSLNGIEADECCLVVQDPSHSIHSSPNFVTLQHFEHAWRAYGTDEDILFIARKP